MNTGIQKYELLDQWLTIIIMKARGWISRYEIKPINIQGRLKGLFQGKEV